MGRGEDSNIEVVDRQAIKRTLKAEVKKKRQVNILVTLKLIILRYKPFCMDKRSKASEWYSAFQGKDNIKRWTISGQSIQTGFGNQLRPTFIVKTTPT